jgi:hypothetical protein
VIGLYELLGNATTSLSHPGPKVTKKNNRYTKTGRHDVAEILLKVALNTKHH